MKLGGRHYQTTADVEARYGVPAGGYQPIQAVRTGPLTTNQHILYLLLTVFTAGLFLPVWIWLAIRGNREARSDHATQ